MKGFTTADVQRALEEHNPRTAYRQYVLAHLPAAAAVSAPTTMQPHLSQRREAFLFPNPFERLVFTNPGGLPFTPQIQYVV